MGAGRAGTGRRKRDHLGQRASLSCASRDQALLRPGRRGAAVVSLAFLWPSAEALSRSPMERQALAAGASFEQRDGWNVAVRFDGLEAERERARSAVAFADLSHLGKVELQGPQPRHLDLGTATHADGM